MKHYTSANDSDSMGVMLLSDLRELFAESNREQLTTEEILQVLHHREDRPWPEFRQGRSITPSQMARLLHIFRISPKNLRVVGSTSPVRKGYLRADFEEAFTRYLPTPPATTLQTGVVGANPEVPPATETGGVAASQGRFSFVDGACSGVADSTAASGGDSLPGDGRVHQGDRSPITLGS